jgi:hypothetical protein
MEWIHCHLARLPVSPCARANGIRGAISAIVMKLLAKSAEERFQTATGVEADLRHCLSASETHGQIESFSLGACDVPDRLLVSEKLYGREEEIELLLALWSFRVPPFLAMFSSKIRLISATVAGFAIRLWPAGTIFSDSAPSKWELL